MQQLNVNTVFWIYTVKIKLGTRIKHNAVMEFIRSRAADQNKRVDLGRVSILPSCSAPRAQEYLRIGFSAEESSTLALLHRAGPSAGVPGLGPTAVIMAKLLRPTHQLPRPNTFMTTKKFRAPRKRPAPEARSSRTHQSTFQRCCQPLPNPRG